MNAILALQSESPRVAATTFLLENGTSILGRSSKCDLVVTHLTVSRRHAELISIEDSVRVRDLGSRNGTLMDNKHVLTAIMHLGQRVRFGSVVFLLTLVATETPDLSSDIETARCSMSEPPNDIAPGDLSKAQRRVLALLLEGLAEKQVAARLQISPTTVHNHIQAIYRGFNVHSRPELLVRLLAKNDSPNASLS